MQAAMFDVVAVGEINADLILSGDVTPAFGQKEKLLDDARLVIGSSTAIFACAAARLGLRTAIIGKVGTDIFGRFMIDALNQRGVDTAGVVVDTEAATGLSVILSRGADRAILTSPGAISALRYSEVSLSIVHAARHLHLGSFFLLDALRCDVPRLFQEARRSGATVSIDTNFDPAEAWNGGLREALRHVDVFLPNATEATAIAGKESTEEAIGAFAESIPLVAVKLGERGAMAKQGSAPAISLSAPVVDVVDTVGAGDCFDAGFVFGFLSGWQPRRALQLGIACGSLSTRRAGGTDSQPGLEEAMRFIGDRGP
jgi:sugar/nucleoside kinase (ribokinase family)